jgi:hypothetical protein
MCHNTRRARVRDCRGRSTSTSSTDSVWRRHSRRTRRARATRSDIVNVARGKRATMQRVAQELDALAQVRRSKAVYRRGSRRTQRTTENNGEQRRTTENSGKEEHRVLGGFLCVSAALCGDAFVPPAMPLGIATDQRALQLQTGRVDLDVGLRPRAVEAVERLRRIV